MFNLSSLIIQNEPYFNQLIGMNTQNFYSFLNDFEKEYYFMDKSMSEIELITERPHQLFLGLSYLKSQDEFEKYLNSENLPEFDFKYWGKKYGEIISKILLARFNNASLDIDVTPLNYYQRLVDEMAGISIYADSTIAAIKSDIRKKREAFSLMNELQQNIDAGVSISDVLSMVLNNLCIKFRMDSAGVFLLNSEKELVLTSKFGLSGNISDNEVIPYNYYQTTAVEGNTIQVKGSVESDFSKKIILILGIPFFIAVPIYSHDEIIGLLISGRLKQIKPFFSELDQSDIDVLQVIASFISVSYTNSNMYNILDDLVQQKTGELAMAQSAIVQSEKMASLGQLTAGIAHEINNPINFVTGNIPPLKRNISRIEELVKLYMELESGITPEKLEAIKKFKRKIDYDYTLEEMGLLLDGIEEGGKRTLTIVKGLRNFSRLDESDLKYASINECIESTLILVTSKIKSQQIELIKDFEEFPEILCYPGQLNQVLINIINNAIQAMGMNGKLTLSTRFIQEENQENNKVLIGIEDNGMGISQEVQQKIFNPFFTTKDVGEGTGLGLSISYGIIQKHEGNIKVESEIGKGSKFIITIPAKTK